MRLCPSQGPGRAPPGTILQCLTRHGYMQWTRYQPAAGSGHSSGPTAAGCSRCPCSCSPPVTGIIFSSGPTARSTRGSPAPTRRRTPGAPAGVAGCRTVDSLPGRRVPCHCRHRRYDYGCAAIDGSGKTVVMAGVARTPTSNGGPTGIRQDLATFDTRFGLPRPSFRSCRQVQHRTLAFLCPDTCCRWGSRTG